MNEKNDLIQLETLPFIPLRDTVVLPHSVIPLNLGRDISILAAEEALSKQDKLIAVSCQKKSNIERPIFQDVYNIGTLARILQSLKTPDGSTKILIEGLKKIEIIEYTYNKKGFIEVKYNTLEEPPISEKQSIEIEALSRQIKEEFKDYVKINRKLPSEVVASIDSIYEPIKLSYTVISYLNIKLQDRQKILEITNTKELLEEVIKLIISEKEISKIEERVHSRVRQQIEKTQKEYYLTEQMKAIQKELRQKDDFAKEIEELKDKIKQAKMPTDVEETALKELSRLEKMMPYSPEATVVRTYLDWLIALPWSTKTKDVIDIHKAKQILDEDHYGLDKIKDRVLEYLAVLKRVKKIKGPILCFVGPPGVGKTSIARSIARALGRNFVSVSLGGVRDEAEIRGHRRTYIGALPGRIIQQMRKAKSKNPVFLLDEIDKMGVDWRGDPSAALLEVLDPEQNYKFVDHYLDVEFDLSDLIFICTANTTYTISPTLLDRLEIINFSGYTWEEKLQIAKKYLIPKELKNHGAESSEIEIPDDTIKEIIDKYTREAGVRNLQREIANLIRKALKEISLAEEQNNKKNKKNGKRIVVTKDLLQKYLGAPKYIKGSTLENGIGVVTGLAWTEYGGETLSVEVAMFNGAGKLILTGKLGEVMQESAQAALSYIRSIADKLKVNPEVFKKNDLHIHIPEGAIPKDGPSAGVAIATAIASITTKRKVKPEIAMTGEITLQGKVLPIGGLKEKLIAAYREGIKTVYFPEANKKDLDEIPQYVKDKIKLVPVSHIKEILDKVLL
ncbi:MAG: endopeptidase La [Endomicrobia bacterium]|nr:endopeptidase La [Endomicrobiia bacterium]